MKQNFLGYLLTTIFPGKHIECIKSKLSSACYALRLVKPFVTINTLRMIYYSYFHSVMTYGLLFWGNSPDSIKIFRLQRRLLELWQAVEVQIHVENSLLTWKSYLSHLSTFFPFFCLC